MSGAACSNSGVGRVRPAAAAAVRPRLAAALRVQRSSSRAASRRNIVGVRAVLNVTDDTFDEEVLKVRLRRMMGGPTSWPDLRLALMRAELMFHCRPSV